MDSILTSVKKQVMGDEYDEPSLDTKFITNINTALLILNQLGVGPDNGFSISDKTATWQQFIGSYPNLEAVKSYVYLKVNMLYDPPTSGAVIEIMKQTIAEMEWRINDAAESLRIKALKGGPHIEQ